MNPPIPLNDENLKVACRWLAERDPDLARVLSRFGPPPLWPLEPGFATLISIILEQQVSLASAHAAFQRLEGFIHPVTPQAFLSLDDETLKAAGFSRQKTLYGRILAQAVLDGALDLSGLSHLADEQVFAALTQVKGIGRWTVDVYLMRALLRPDIWPAGDLALATAVQWIKGLDFLPVRADLEALGRRYAPWRAVAARLFWHAYLSVPGRKARAEFSDWGPLEGN